MKALLHYRASPGFRAAIERAAPNWLEVAIVDEDDTESLSEELPDTAVLLHVLEPVTADMIAAAPELKLIQKIGVGVNTIDLDAARSTNVAVANMPGTNSRAVAEMTLALMLGVLRRLTYLDPLTRAGDGWSPDPEQMDGIGEVAGRTVGLVGFGEIPQRLAPILEAMGAEVIFAAREDREGDQRQVDLSELVERSDIVSLHIPLTADTERMFDAEMLARMKPGAVLVNTARGGLVDQPALTEALVEGRLGGAGLDVFAREPVEAGDPLLTLPNVVVAPHIAWLTPETLERSMGVAFENCRRVRDGEPLLHRVC